MASRRLAISSLLCDGDDASRPQSRDSDRYVPRSPPPALSPHDDDDVGPPAHTGSSYSQSAHIRFGARRSLLDNKQRGSIDVQGPRRPLSPSPIIAPSRSITPVPLALQPASIQHRTPSPPPMSLPPSPHPNDQYELAGVPQAYFVENEQAPRSANPYGAEASTIVAQPQRYSTRPVAPFSRYSQSPPSSSSGIIEDASVGRTSLPVSSFRYSPPVPRHPLPVESRDTLPSSSYRSGPYVSPIVTTFTQSQSYHDVPPSVHAEHLVNTRRYVAAASPSVSKPQVPSGLDVLVQAATEERERIDEHRRASGGSDKSLLPMDDHSSRNRIHSPVTDARTQRFSPEWPTRHLPSQAGTHIYAHSPMAEQPRTIYNHDIHPARHSRPLDRRRSPSEARPISPQSIPAHPNRPINFHGDYGGSISPLTTNSHDHIHSTAPVEELLTDSRIRTISLSKSVPTQSVSSPHTSPTVRYHLGDDQLSTYPRRPSGQSTPSTLPGSAHFRRSPPRSKPKPRKPGSSADARADKVSPRQISVAGVPVPVPEAEKRVTTQSVRNLDPSSQRSEAWKSRVVPTTDGSRRPSSGRIPVKEEEEEEEEEEEDQDAHDFFLSVFDSPRRASATNGRGDSLLPALAGELKRAPIVRTSQGTRSHEVLDAASVVEAPPHSWMKHSRSPAPETDLEEDIIMAAQRSSVGELSEAPADTDDVEGELAEAVADSMYGSGDEHMEGTSGFVDNMDVDVEDELLSLVEPSQTHEVAHTHHSRHLGSDVKAYSGSGQHVRSRLSPESLDRLSMPPPATGVVGPGKARGKSGKSILNKKEKSTAEDKTASGPQSKAIKRSVSKQEDGTEKNSKPKPTAKPKGKGAASDKSKAKQSKESLHLEEAQASASSVNLPAGEPFPVVTSSGRMVKKSIAAAQSASSKKKTIASSTLDTRDSRSRSHSVAPGASVDSESQHEREKIIKAGDEKVKEIKEDEDVADEDDKLYCICRTKYDEDRVMIACDRCDEWYHTQCVKMRDLEVDLVDQFICPICIKQNPSLNLKTTYKQRCFAGLKHSKPNSIDACHKPARGAYSKYCSDECGVRYIHMKVQIWASKGGEVDRLWETVKDAKRREGVVVQQCHTLPKTVLAELSNHTPPPSLTTTLATEVSQELPAPATSETAALRTPGAKQRIDALETQLGKVVAEREARKKEMEVIEWRQRLLDLAVERAERVGECGWDQRLCFGDEEWQEFGEGVLESYEETGAEGTSNGEDGMEVDGEDGVWWCRGKKKCERHVGWQKMRKAELMNEREARTDLLIQLTTREREIRSRIEDIVHPKPRTSGDGCLPRLPLLKSLNGLNGSGKALEDGVKKGKKKVNGAK